jgi:predicted nucleic acid-binding protein
MLVVSDSSPINFLVRLDVVHILPAIFGRVLIPPQVVAELSQSSTPAAVRTFIVSPPEWLEVRSPIHIDRIPKLDPGEEAAISLAKETKSPIILLDDGDARRIAVQMGFGVVGLLGILERAHAQRLLDLAEIASRLPADYRIAPEVVKAAVDRRNRRGN